MVITPTLLVGIIVIHFALLMGIAWLTSRNSDNSSFFVANRNAPWLLVAFGMIGTSISGVTFVSVPGAVGNPPEVANANCSYLQLVLGNLVGYFVVAAVLLPLYYKNNVVSIYQYLENRFGFYTYKSGAGMFIVSRVIGAAFRLYLMALVLQTFVLDSFGIPFEVTAILVPALIWVYTFKGGTKTVLWTDTIQTVLFLSALLFTLSDISNLLGKDSMSHFISEIWDGPYAKVFHFDHGWSSPNYFLKQFLAGLLTVIAMVGLDQDLMQKNLTCKSLKDAQKNVFTFSAIILLVNILFLTLGAALYIFAQNKGITLPSKSDQVYPFLAFNHLSTSIGIIFMIGIVACSYSAADSALTSLTTSFCVDFLDFQKVEESPKKHKTRTLIHLGFTVLLALVIMIFHYLNSESIVNQIFKIAGYTYGPLLGIFAYGIIFKGNVADRYMPYICIVAPIITYIIDKNSVEWFGGFTLGFLNLALNALLTMLMIWIVSIWKK